MGNCILKDKNNMQANNVQDMINNNKVMIFSKSYCPFAAKAKKIFSDAGVAGCIVELDVVQGGDAMQSALKDLSGQRTVPNIYINGKHLGGCDDTISAAQNGKLKTMLNECGVANNL